MDAVQPLRATFSLYIHQDQCTKGSRSRTKHQYHL